MRDLNNYLVTHQVHIPLTTFRGVVFVRDGQVAGFIMIYVRMWAKCM